MLGGTDFQEAARSKARLEKRLRKSLQGVQPYPLSRLQRTGCQLECPGMHGALKKESKWEGGMEAERGERGRERESERGRGREKEKGRKKQKERERERRGEREKGRERERAGGREGGAAVALRL